MADKKIQRAQKVYETLCDTLDKWELHYRKNDEELSIECGAQGEDLPMEITIKVDSERQLIMLLSRLPFVISEEKRLDVAVAVSVVNSKLVDGSFDYNVADGHIFFRMTSSFIESDVGNELFVYMLMVSYRTIDEYNDKFLMLGKGMIGIEKFISNT